MRNAGLEEAQAGIKIAGRNINTLRYADDTTLMAESEEELKNLSMKVKEESENVGLKLNIQNTKIKASGPISSVQFSCSVVSVSFATQWTSPRGSYVRGIFQAKILEWVVIFLLQGIFLTQE